MDKSMWTHDVLVSLLAPVAGVCRDLIPFSHRSVRAVQHWLTVGGQVHVRAPVSGSKLVKYPDNF